MSKSAADLISQARKKGDLLTPDVGSLGIPAAQPIPTLPIFLIDLFHILWGWKDHEVAPT